VHRVWLGAAVVVCAGCVHPLVGPSRTVGDYQKKAAHTAETVRSAVESARLAADVARHGDSFGPYLSVVVGEADQDASGTHSDFDAVQPPGDRADTIRSQLDDLLNNVDTTLSEMRIAIRRDRMAEMVRAAAPLQDLSQSLEQFRKAHQ
jgi:hypothetical protein